MAHQTKSVTIYVNGTPFPWEKGEIARYEDIAALAFSDYGQNPQITYSIVYEKGHGESPEGILPVGGTVKVKDEMEFRVSRTGES